MSLKKKMKKTVTESEVSGSSSDSLPVGKQQCSPVDKMVRSSGNVINKRDKDNGTDGNNTG